MWPGRDAAVSMIERCGDAATTYGLDFYAADIWNTGPPCAASFLPQRFRKRIEYKKAWASNPLGKDIMMEFGIISSIKLFTCLESETRS